jgi:hypothetical protein
MLALKWVSTTEVGLNVDSFVGTVVGSNVGFSFVTFVVGSGDVGRGVGVAVRGSVGTKVGSANVGSLVGIVVVACFGNVGVSLGILVGVSVVEESAGKEGAGVAIVSSVGSSSLDEGINFPPVGILLGRVVLVLGSDF